MICIANKFPGTLRPWVQEHSEDLWNRSVLLNRGVWKHLETLQAATVGGAGEVERLLSPRWTAPPNRETPSTGGHRAS